MKSKEERYLINEGVYFERYEGYITTKMRPRANEGELEKLKNMIVEKNKQ
ncbi:MAG: hypothetical protein M1360_03005 [Candidatus Marsarchaeota archaeon]|jgi:hypothetical protein|nr:hypothetical protein [Candidatus Marsarchaeota archaeon]MCL5418883.1 hypothetical protein [Candidatus Marsarchaeota archaeon]